VNLTLANARIVTPTAVILGALTASGGRIDAIEAGARRGAGAIDCHGDFVIPGLIDLHTDNLEHHFAPRPAVRWPSAVSAVLAHDRQMLGAGVTTVLDALSLGDYDSGGARSAMLHVAMEGIREAYGSGLLAADHFIHFRCELSDPGLLDAFEPHAGHARLKLISLMDHTPGQRQWRDTDKYRAFRRVKNGRVWSEDEFADYLARRRTQQAACVAAFRARIRAAATARRIPLASHDDTTVQDVEQSHSEDVAIAEFPTTLEAARAARRLGMKIVMGAALIPAMSARRNLQRTACSTCSRPIMRRPVSYRRFLASPRMGWRCPPPSRWRRLIPPTAWVSTTAVGLSLVCAPIFCASGSSTGRRR
jgi:alpha-D-ribose 1-methylphosphonate 5-triphosphate diphosphatase